MCSFKLGQHQLSHASQEEAQRLQSILVSFPTNAEQDAAFLDSGELTDWREKVIVKFRLLRKQALVSVIKVPPSHSLLCSHTQSCFTHLWAHSKGMHFPSTTSVYLSRSTEELTEYA